MFFENRVDIIELENGSARVLSVKKKEKGAFSVLRAFKPANAAALSAGNGGKRVFVFPRELCILRFLEIEGAGPELETAVIKETEEGLPFEKEKALWDAQVMSLTGKVSSVLFAAASKDQVAAFLKPIGAQGKQGFVICPATLGLYELIRMNGGGNNGPCMAVYVSKSRYDILAAKKGAIVFSRGVLLSEEPDIAGALAAAASSLARDGFVPGVVYTNSAELNAGMEKKGFKASLLALPKELADEIKGAGGEPSEFLLCAGIAASTLGLGAFTADLNSGSAGDAFVPGLLNIIKKASYAVSGLLLLLSLVFFVMSKSAENNAGAVRAELSRLGGLSGKSWSRSVVDISKTVPPQVILNELSSDTRGDITVRGVSDTRQAVTVFLDNLNKMQGSSAELAFANDTGAGSKQSVQFQIKVQLRGSK